MTTQHLIVAFHCVDKSLPALQWAINRCRLEQADLTVIHATSAPVSVRNGPTPAIASQLGDPVWATVHSTVLGLGAPPGTTTIVERGEPADVIARHVTDDAVIILGRRCGPSWRRYGTERLLTRRVDVPIIRIDSYFAKTPVNRPAQQERPPKRIRAGAQLIQRHTASSKGITR